MQSSRVRPPTTRQLNRLVSEFESKRGELTLFLRQVADFFQISTKLNQGAHPIVHSVKYRLKDPDHLREKIRRKWTDGPISPDQLFKRITDLAGVRVLHLHSQQFPEIHNSIMDNISRGTWRLGEDPVAYSWDPEATAFFMGLGLISKTKESYYTSIHYLIKPPGESDIVCEVQVRTLFEEIWGEIDHAINYPAPTRSIACKEQLRVLAKLASTGTRLADAIYRTA